jgi:enamine deaminase RidA (YjgF/YER057c/UK114 family)
MQVQVLNWLGFEFIELSAEAPEGASPEAGTKAIFDAFETVLDSHGLSLENTVRSRLFGRDRLSRDQGSDVRAATLTGPARTATSSYIAPKLFATGAATKMDLIAVRPQVGIEKVIRENDPPRTPCRYFTYGPLMILSGQTAVLDTLEQQVTTNILPRITEYLGEANSSWDQVQQVSCYLHESQTVQDMRDLFLTIAPALPPRFEIRFVEGYSAKGKLVEIEVTATRKA